MLLQTLCTQVQSLRLWQQEQNAFSLTEAAAQRKPAASHLLGNTSMENVTDSLFGTTYLTHGAALQLPRKVPLRIEPKSYFGKPLLVMCCCLYSTQQFSLQHPLRWLCLLQLTSERFWHGCTWLLPWAESSQRCLVSQSQQRMRQRGLLGLVLSLRKPQKLFSYFCYPSPLAWSHMPCLHSTGGAGAWKGNR